ncbi:glycosyltransferase family 4 protein [Chroogloeocystis siderophila]|jgi:glycosyltransferase involved in cell wall biosynthesis|uniref:Group 1 glycosyl transferase n=1 Tax=Chroogloeocystis siderophila 5.2 s.c.1 TaxID=247279 RepID=A0A1U7HDY8_9CHRO|nr:glycosyltransferase family 4 protein [Chroogloeocystis siderophila]OKH21790.1 group 1 glycosyl transferase [Chroogloeocystis siderophila 5.2 s.c.1]
MRKLLIVPVFHHALGGATVSLSMTLKGFQQCGALNQLCVLLRADSLMEQYLCQAGYESCLHLIPERSLGQFMKQALHWVNQQPPDWPVLLENCVARQLLPAMALAAPRLRWSRRPIYLIFRDLAYSPHPLGSLLRKFTLASLAPRAICNSQFTAKHIRKLVPYIEEVLYPPVDLERFNDRPSVKPPPANLQPILNSGARIILTPSRISKSEDNINDKNLRSLLLVLAQLKSRGQNYHGVVIGQDTSSDQQNIRALLAQAKDLGVTDRFTILPPVFAIEDYYKYADVVMTLAPREPFGRTIVEAIACGVPVVGSQTGGIGEILGNFAPEWTVNPYNPAAAAEIIIQIAHSPNSSKLLAQGQRWVETHCSVASYAHRIMEITGLDSTKLPETELVY